MAKHLTEKKIRDICEMMDGWRGPLTWRALAEAVERLIGQRYTRQALNSHERIRLAYTLRKKVVTEQPTRSIGSSNETRAMQERITRLEIERARLTRENERLLGRIAVWAYNASLYGLNEERLNRPMPSTDRDRTKAKALK